MDIPLLAILFVRGNLRGYDYVADGVGSDRAVVVSLGRASTRCCSIEGTVRRVSAIGRGRADSSALLRTSCFAAK